MCTFQAHYRSVTLDSSRSLLKNTKSGNTEDLQCCKTASSLFMRDDWNMQHSSRPLIPAFTLYTTLPHNLIKEKLINLIEWTFKREGSPYIACHERQAFFTSENTKRYKLWSCQNVCEALIYLLDNIYIRFGTKLYRQIVGIPMGTNCTPLVADLFLFCYERDFMTSLSDVKQAEIIEAFKSTSRYLDDLLNIDNPYFEGMVNRIYPPELQLNKANTADTEAPFLDLHLSISNGFVSSKIYDKRDDFDFDIVNFPFLDGNVSVLPLTGFIFLNLFGLLEFLVMWLISMPVIKV